MHSDVTHNPGSLIYRSCYSSCPLSPALLQLLQAVLTTGSGKTKVLACVLYLSPHTINSRLKEINQLLGTEGRTEAVIYGVQQGWLSIISPLPPSPSNVKIIPSARGPRPQVELSENTQN